MRAGGRRCLWLFVAAALASACLDGLGVCTVAPGRAHSAAPLSPHLCPMPCPQLSP